jgi:hypothetical protein
MRAASPVVGTGGLLFYRIRSSEGRIFFIFFRRRLSIIEDLRAARPFDFGATLSLSFIELATPLLPLVSLRLP